MTWTAILIVAAVAIQEPSACTSSLFGPRTGNVRPGAERVLVVCGASFAADSNPSHGRLLAHALTRLDRDRESALVYAAVNRLAPDDWESLFNAALVHRRLGNYDLAISLLERAAGERHDDSMTFETLGYVLFEAGYPERALNAFDIAVQRNSSNTRAWIGAARSAAKLGRHADAVGYWDCAESIFPNRVSAIGEAGDDALYELSRELRGDAESAVTCTRAARQGLLRSPEVWFVWFLIALVLTGIIAVLRLGRLSA